MPQQPVILDLFCKAGGCTKGYQRAGFKVVGVDIEPQPRYCGDEFIQADAMEVLQNLADFDHRYDAIHASPPCQGYSVTASLHSKVYPRLIEPIRTILKSSGVPWVIENVKGAPLIAPMMLCGSAFKLNVWRHRLFESNVKLESKGCWHASCPKPIDVTGTGGPDKRRSKPGGGLSRKPKSMDEASVAMGIDWMIRREIVEAIPPAYTEYIGRQLMRFIGAAA